MHTIDALYAAHHRALAATRSGPPAAPSNPFFGVGPISDGTTDEADRQSRRHDFECWVSDTYRKTDDRGRDLGGYSVTELARSMHRGDPADAILCDMLGAIQRYFCLPKQNQIAVGLGGGHTGFTVSVQHLLSLSDPDQQVFIDTPYPESPEAAASGFFRQSWATQIVDLCRFARHATTERLHFADADGRLPDAHWLDQKGIRLFIGVGHETTGASTYSTAEISGLLEWIDMDPDNHHAIIDATSLLGAMPWPDHIVAQVMAKCCLFMPLQKAIGGIAGYFIASFTPQALRKIETNLRAPSWAIPRQLSLSVPVDPTFPISGPRSVAGGPFYDPEQNRMLGGVINTYSLLAFAETTFGLLTLEKQIGSAAILNARSVENRAVVEDWVAQDPLFKFAVTDPEKRGAAVTLLCMNDPDVGPLHSRVLMRAKHLLGHQGLTHPNGQHETGLNAALYVNAFPGKPGDFRAWIGGVRTTSDITALLKCLRYAWHRAKLVIAEEELARQNAPQSKAIDPVTQ